MSVVRLKEHAGREMLYRKLPIRIGRSPDNDFVLFDDSVSLEHAVIEQGEDGQILLCDLGSRNGTRIGREKIVSMPIERKIRVFIGIIEVEVELLSENVTREVDIREWELLDRRRSLRHHVRYLMLGVLAVLFWKIIEPAFWAPSESNRFLTLLQEGIISAIVLVIISFLLLIVLRAVRRKVRIADTLAAAALVVWVFPFSEVVSTLTYYLFPISLGDIADTLVRAASAIWGFTFLASIRREPKSALFRLGWAGGTTIVMILLGITSHYSGQKKGQPAVDYDVFPPIAGFSGPTTGLDEYFLQIDEHAQEALEEAVERREKRLRSE